MDRRAYLSLVGAGVIAGCSGDDSDDGTADGSDGGDGSDGSDGGDGEDGEDTNADPSTVSFDILWDQFFDSEGVISGQNFGADATPDGVFIGAEWGFAALGLDDGSRMWEKDEWEGFIDIHADSDGVIAYTNSFEIVSLNPSDGTEQWRRSVSEAQNTFLSSALTDSYVFAQTANGLGVYDRASGDVVTEFDQSPQSLVVSDDVAIFLQSAGMTAYDVSNGSERWQKQVILGRGAVIDDGRLIGLKSEIGPDAGGSLKAYDLESGEESYSVAVDNVSFGLSALAVENDVAVWLSGSMGEDSTLSAHNVSDGSQRWTKNLGQVPSSSFSPPATDSGVVIAPALTEDNRSKVRAFEAKSGDRLSETDGGIGITRAEAIDRVFLEIGLNEVTAKEF
jgi:outer membrane protein assembly factor BamB